jgi:Periplasmic sensor domain found in signal transduction proteins
LKTIIHCYELLRKPSIGRRFALAILAFSSIVTLASTALQLSIEYQRDVDDIKSQLGQIRDGYSQSLASSLWVTSQKDLQLQLDGIIKLPDIQMRMNYWLPQG